MNTSAVYSPVGNPPALCRRKSVADAWLYVTCFFGSSIPLLPEVHFTPIVPDPAPPVRTERKMESSGEKTVVIPLTVLSEFRDRPSCMAVICKCRPDPHPTRHKTRIAGSIPRSFGIGRNCIRRNLDIKEVAAAVCRAEWQAPM